MEVCKTIPAIELHRMPQLVEAVDPEDDWTGVSDAALRRKRQNRLNVRAYRRRQARDIEAHAKFPILPEVEGSIPCWVEDQQAVIPMPASLATPRSDTRGPLLPSTPQRTRLKRIILPLSSDHLITLLQFNALRGLLLNRQLISRLYPRPPYENECSSAALHVLPGTTEGAIREVPSALHPTLLQQTVPHEDWIDTIPHPIVRDNIIKALGTFNEDELWSDTIGGLFEGFPASEIEQRGVVMWSPPWHVSGWEISEGFWQKWGWSLKGCGEILDAANYWRRLRGEKPLAL